MEFFKQLPTWLRLWLIFPLAFLNGWLFFLLVSYLNPLISIFLTAALLAFLLNFPIHFLQRRGCSKGGAITVVLLIALLIVSLLALILIPLILQQLSQFVTNLPEWINSGSEQLQVVKKWAITQKLSANIDSFLGEIANRLSSALQSVSTQFLSVLLGTITSLINVLLVLVLTVFLVITGESVWEGIFSWFPAPWNTKLPDSIQKTFTRYFAGQAILAGILSVAEVIVFTFLNVPYSALFAVTIGLTTLIPYASGFTILIISFLLSLQNFSLGIKVLIAAIIVGQINDNVIAPRLVGGITGLNPVWIIVSLFIGGEVGGILGLLIAVPLASIIKNTADELKISRKTKNIISVEGIKDAEVEGEP